jgi:two-component system, chemotaxis family, chemotaxis protein CheY
VLVVEDSATMRGFVTAALEAAGPYAVTQAESGFHALKILPRGRYDLIITDINMPDINGLELIGYVKSNPTYRDIPLIIVSTEKTEEDKKRGLTLGAAGYLVKPFRKEELMGMVTKVLEAAARNAR